MPRIKARRPALTLQIAQDYFEDFLASETGYVLDEENGLYTKTIGEADLSFEFASDTDGTLQSLLTEGSPKIYFRNYFELFDSHIFNWIRNRRFSFYKFWR